MISPIIRSASPEITSSPEVLLAEVEREMTNPNHTSFLRRAIAVWAPLLFANPRIQQMIREFQEAHPEKMALIKKHSWNAIKSDPSIRGGKWTGVNMRRKQDSDNLSMEEFRAAYNQLLVEVTAEAAKMMDISPVIWTASGTPGYNSDVDTAMIPQSRDFTTADAYMMKFLRDTAHTLVGGGLSGTQLDTESYTPHPAKKETGSKLSDAGLRQGYVTSELCMAYMQGKQGLSSENWQELMQRERELSSSRAMDTSVQAMREIIDAWYDSIEDDIQRQMIFEYLASQDTENTPREVLRRQASEMSDDEVETLVHLIKAENPSAYKEAALNYKVPIMTRIAKNIATKQEGLRELLSLFRTEEEAYANREVQSLLLEIDILEKMLNCLQDEGTFTQSEGNCTLLEKRDRCGRAMRKRSEDMSWNI